MRYISTRNKNKTYTAAQAIAQGLAPDGGLLTPEKLPVLPDGTLEKMLDMTYQQRAVTVMKLFLDDYTDEELAGFAASAYSREKFDAPEVAPLRVLDGNTACLELWHDPACAFKDMALQMLPYLLSAALKKNDEKRTVCILVATSGDTGKAALEGFRDVNGTRILVFYPKNGVSKIQQLQMTTQGGENVGVCAVVGNFDDAQSGVKALFSDEQLRETLSSRGYFFSSANSINWGRVLPQVVYYVSAYCDLVKAGSVSMGQPVNICVPTGNFGNILAGYYAKCMGVPVGKLICASNSNNVLTDFLTTGVYDKNRPFYTTTSPSMDILISSNLERLLFALSGQNDALVADYMAQLNKTGRYEVTPEIAASVRQLFAAGCCTDEQAAQTMAELYGNRDYLIDPHTAVAFHVLQQYRAQSGDDTPCIVVSTASPFKFCDSVLTALGVSELAEGTDILAQTTAVTGRPAPAPLAGLADRKIRFTDYVEKEQMVDKVLEMLR